jgi:hypothetical protein
MDLWKTYNGYRFMPDIRPDATPQPTLPRKPSVRDFLADVRRLFAAGKVKWTWHAEGERMPERGFDEFDVETVIMKGHCPDGVKPAKNSGEWKGTIIDQLEGTSRKLGVVCVVRSGVLLIIVTTEWEDR